MINAVLPTFDESKFPEEGQSRYEFRTNASYAWKTFKDYLDVVNTYNDEINGSINNIQSMVSDVDQTKQEIESKINDINNNLTTSQSYANDAINAANEIKNYVVPTDATLSTDAIAEKMEDIIRIQVATMSVYSINNQGV